MKCVERLELSFWGFRLILVLRLMLMLMLKLMLILMLIFKFSFPWPVVPSAIFCNNPLSVSIVFERRAKYSGAIFKDSLHFQWWAGNFNFTFERVQHTINSIKSCLVWYFAFEWHYIQEDFTLHYPIQSPNSRSHHRRSKREPTPPLLWNFLPHCQQLEKAILIMLYQTKKKIKWLPCGFI